ncbi:MAG: PIN domain-containing protein [Xenococcaceae cyanobacterium]
MSENKPDDSCFIDSNLWFYALATNSDGDSKCETAKALIKRQGIVVSTQVINEVCVNLLRKSSINEQQIKDLILSFYQRYRVVSFNGDILLEASDLRSRYLFSFWDSLIVASALYAGVKILYSEDMRDGLIVSEKLQIINPFTASSQ